MKVFFSLLLIGNIIFGLVQWLMPYEQVKVENSKIAVAEKLVLLSETAKSIPVDEVQAEQNIQNSGIVEALVTEDASDKRLCFTIGPFKRKSNAIEVSGRYSAIQIETELKSSLEQEYLGIMVFVDEHKSRMDAVATAKKLARSGISDYMIINEPGKTFALSLGVFGLKKNAERLFGRVKRMKIPVKTEARYRQRTIYWLYHEQSSESNLQSLLTSEDLEKGVSQIPRDCS